MPKLLNGFDELVLLTVASLGDAAYGVTVQQRLERESRSTVSLGAVYAVLERLERQGFVRSAWGEATPQRGGRRKRLFQITAAGVSVLRGAERLRARLWPFPWQPRPA